MKRGVLSLQRGIKDQTQLFSLWFLLLERFYSLPSAYDKGEIFPSDSPFVTNNIGKHKLRLDVAVLCQKVKSMSTSHLK